MIEVVISVKLWIDYLCETGMQGGAIHESGRSMNLRVKGI
jgi:hypothetical protein